MRLAPYSITPTFPPSGAPVIAVGNPANGGFAAGSAVIDLRSESGKSAPKRLGSTVGNQGSRDLGSPEESLHDAQKRPWDETWKSDSEDQVKRSLSFEQIKRAKTLDLSPSAGEKAAQQEKELEMELAASAASVPPSPAPSASAAPPESRDPPKDAREVKDNLWWK